MPIIIDRQSRLPTSPAEALSMALRGLEAILHYLKGLYTLDADLRETRSEAAERALVFVSFPVVAGGVTRLSDLWPDVVNSPYSTALIMFDSAAGTGRWRMDGGVPVSAATAAAGMPIPAGFSTLTIVGALNIRSFQVIGEPAQTLNMSVTLFK